MIQIAPICFDCKHMIEGAGCKAFPDAIPEEIAMGEVDHHFPYDGDHGIQFEPIEKPPQDDGDGKSAGPEGPAPEQ